MKKVILVSSAFTALVLASCSSSTTTHGDKDAKVQSADSTQIFNLDTAALAAGTVYYQCPMELDVISDKPGACPKCGMDLEPVTKQ